MLARSYHKQDNGILTKGRAQKSMEEKLQPTKILLHILSVDFQRICEINCMEKILPFPEILLEHLDNILKKEIYGKFLTSHKKITQNGF